MEVTEVKERREEEAERLTTNIPGRGGQRTKVQARSQSFSSDCNEEGGNERRGGGLRFLDCRQKSVQACCKGVAQA